MYCKTRNQKMFANGVKSVFDIFNKIYFSVNSGIILFFHNLIVINFLSIFLFVSIEGVIGAKFDPSDVELREKYSFSVQI
jgi:hypothetical protein